MAKPTALTENGGSKTRLLADSTATTPLARADAAVESAPSGEATYPVGWAGVATHRTGDALNGPGGFTTSGAGPVVAIAGNDDGTIKAIEAETSVPTGTEVGLLVRPIPQDMGLANGSGRVAIADVSNNPVGVTAGRLNVDTGGGGGTSYSDETAFTVGAGGSQVNPVGGVLSADAVAAGTVGAVGMTAQRELRVQIGSAGTAVAMTGTSLNVANTASLPAGTNNIGDVDVLSLPSLPTGGNNIGDVDVVSIVPGTTGSSLGKAEDAVHASGDTGVAAWGVANDTNTAFCATGDYCPRATDTEGSSRTIGNRAHDAVDSGNPLKIGGKAVNMSALPADVGVLDRVDASFDLKGRQLVIVDLAVPTKDQGWDHGSVVPQRGLAVGVTATTDQTLLAADASNIYNVLDVSVDIFAGTAAPAAKAYVSLFHGPSASGVEFMRVYAPTAANGVTTKPVSFRLPDRGASNQAVVAKLNASLGTNGEYSVTVHAYKTTT